MIRTISFMEGGSELAAAVQEHALEMARHFGARLHAVVAWEPKDIEKLNHAGADEDPEQLTEPEVSDSLRRAEEQGIYCEPTFHGEGVVEGLLAEARQSDLLIIGVPPEGSEPETPLLRTLIEDGIRLLRKAESSLLVVSDRFTVPTHLLVVYQGGIAGKSALRLGGYVAETFGAQITVASFAPRISDSTILASLAESYLDAYELPSVDSLPQHGEGPEAADINEIAQKVHADCIVFGAEPYGVLESFFGHKTAERLAVRTRTPVLIAR